MQAAHLSLAAAVTFNGVANVLIRHAMGRLSTTAGGDLPTTLLAALRQPTLYLGGLCFALGLAAYAYSLTAVKLSIAYAVMISLSYAIVFVASLVLFGETITHLQGLGLGLILVGLWLLSTGTG